jgi:quercetin dioxygenase-like cupin family protein
MRVLKFSDVPEQEVVDNPLFTGGAVTRQPMIGAEESQFFGMAIVSFHPGARNKFHTHTSDQLLIVTSGTGIVASETEERVVSVGEAAHITAGEKHWHGATADSAFSHITVTATGSQTEQLEP